MFSQLTLQLIRTGRTRTAGTGGLALPRARVDTVITVTCAARITTIPGGVQRQILQLLLLRRVRSVQQKINAELVVMARSSDTVQQIVLPGIVQQIIQWVI